MDIEIKYTRDGEEVQRKFTFDTYTGRDAVLRLIEGGERMLERGERRNCPPAMTLDTSDVRPYHGVRGAVASIEAKRTARIEEQEAKWLVHTLIEATGAHRDEEDFLDLIFEGAQTLARLKPCWWKAEVVHRRWMGWLQYGQNNNVEFENISPMQLAGLAALGQLAERHDEEALLTDKLFLTHEAQARLTDLFSGSGNTALDLGETMESAANEGIQVGAEDRGKKNGENHGEEPGTVAWSHSLTLKSGLKRGHGRREATSQG